MRGQIIIIKFGVTDDSYQYKGLWSPFVESNFSLSLSEEKNLEKKKKGSLQLEDHKTNILINLSSSFHYVKSRYASASSFHHDFLVWEHKGVLFISVQ